MPSREWRTWPKRAIKEINASSGVVGLAGVALGLAASPILTAVGGVVVAGALGVAAWKGFPEKKNNPSELVGKGLDLDALKNVSPLPKKLGLIGASRSGKTTLLDHLRNATAEGLRTDEVYAAIVPLQVNPEKYVALIDGAGHQYSQQFKVAENSDILVIFLDHDKSDFKKQATKKRLAEHAEFLAQLVYYLRGNRSTPLSHVHLLLNKKDLWNDDAKKSELEDWFNNILTTWQGNGLAEEVSWAYHSNRSPDDITIFVNYLAGLA